MTIRDPYDSVVPTDGGPVLHLGMERPARFEDTVRRNHQGRPYVKDPETGAEVSYTRCTTFIKGIDDTRHIDNWRHARILDGFAQASDRYAAKVTALASEPDDKARRAGYLELVEELIERGGGNDQRELGTALHTLADRDDLGFYTPVVPADLVADRAARRIVMLPFEIVYLERFMVHDGLQVGGTPDRIVRIKRPCAACGRSLRILDNKTGRQDDFTHRETAMQLYIYSISMLYEPESGQRIEIPDLCSCIGYVAHLPAGEGKAYLLEIDYEPVKKFVHELIPAIRAARNIRPRPVTLDPVAMAIRGAVSLDELLAVWTAAGEAWTAEHTDLARLRRAEVEPPAVAVAAGSDTEGAP